MNYSPEISSEDDSKDEDICLKFEDRLSEIVKKEEGTDHKFENFENLAFSHQVNKRLDELLVVLEQYLENFVNVEDFVLDPQLRSADTENLVSEAKSHFKCWGAEIIRSLGEHLKKKAVQHFLPESYLVQVIGDSKKRIYNSYRQLKRNILETLYSVLQQSDENFKKIKVKPNKRTGKKKCEFPAEAKSLLKAWFIAHAHDPYPSHEEKIELAREAKISMKQLENWLTNTRGRIWKKMQNEPRFENEVEKTFWKNEENLV